MQLGKWPTKHAFRRKSRPAAPFSHNFFILSLVFAAFLRRSAFTFLCAPARDAVTSFGTPIKMTKQELSVVPVVLWAAESIEVDQFGAQ